MGWGPSAPKPDPAIGEAAKSNSEIADRQQDLAERAYNDQQAIYDELSPLLREQLQLSATEQAKSIERGDAQWDSYTRTFQPLEAKMAETAANFDTPQRREQVASGRAPEPKLEDVTVTAAGGDRRVVTFVQRFGDGGLRKELTLVREAAGWRIVSERTLEVL